MPALSPRVAASVLFVAAAFVGGIAFDELGHREARAQSLTTSNIVVPEGGLDFRAPDGTAVARLARDANRRDLRAVRRHAARGDEGAAAEPVRGRAGSVEARRRRWGIGRGRGSSRVLKNSG